MRSSLSDTSRAAAAVFDTLFATSTRNDTPEITPAPFDANRDGLVLGEGACTLILEELEHALARGARIYAELVGFGTNTDGSPPFFAGLALTAATIFWMSRNLWWWTGLP